MYRVFGMRPNAANARARVLGRLLLSSDRMSSEALTVP